MDIQKYNKQIFPNLDGIFLSFVEQVCLINNNYPILEVYNRIRTQGVIFDCCLESFNYYGDMEGIPQIWIITDNDEFQGIIIFSYKINILHTIIIIL